MDESVDAARTGIVDAVPSIFWGVEKAISIRKDGAIQAYRDNAL